MILLIVDTQSLIVTKQLYKFDEVVNNISRLINQARKCDVEIIYIRHDDGEGEKLTKGAEGHEIYDAFAPISGEMIFDKNNNSAFRGTGLLEYLNQKNERKIMIVGLQTDYCIDATIKCGFEHGLHMIVPSYANSTVDNEYMTARQSYEYYNEKMWNNRYAECIPMEEALNIIAKNVIKFQENEI